VDVMDLCAGPAEHRTGGERSVAFLGVPFRVVMCGVAETSIGAEILSTFIESSTEPESGTARPTQQGCRALIWPLK